MCVSSLPEPLLGRKRRLRALTHGWNTPSKVTPPSPLRVNIKYWIRQGCHKPGYPGRLLKVFPNNVPVAPCCLDLDSKRYIKTDYFLKYWTTLTIQSLQWRNVRHSYKLKYCWSSSWNSNDEAQFLIQIGLLLVNVSHTKRKKNSKNRLFVCFLQTRLQKGCLRLALSCDTEWAPNSAGNASCLSTGCLGFTYVYSTSSRCVNCTHRRAGAPPSSLTSPLCWWQATTTLKLLSRLIKKKCTLTCRVWALCRARAPVTLSCMKLFSIDSGYVPRVWMMRGTRRERSDFGWRGFRV